MQPSPAWLCGVALLISVGGCGGNSKTDIESGNRLFQEGTYPEAALRYRSAIRRDPLLADAHYRLGLVFIKQSKPNEAIASLSKALELAPRHDDALGKLSDLLLTFYLRDRSPQNSIHTRLSALSEQALKQNPRSFHGWRIQGYLKMTDLEAEEARRAFDKALEIRPEDADVSLAIVRPLLDLNEAAMAEKIVRNAIEKHKDFGPLYDVLYLLFLSQNRIPDAENVLRTKRRDNPANTAFALQVCAHYDRYKKAPEMAAAIQHVLDDPRNYPDGPLKVSEFYAQRHNWKDAAAQVEFGMRSSPEQSAKFKTLRMSILLTQGKTEEALQLAGNLLNSDPKDRVGLTVRGTLAVRQGHLDEALKDLRTLAEANPNDPVSRFKLGRVYHLKGLLAHAKAEYGRSVQLRAAYTPPQMGLAELSFEQRDFAGAVRRLEDIRKFDPKNPEVRVALSASMMALGNQREARRELTGVLKEFPEYPQAEVQLAYLGLTQKHYREAETLFKKHYRPESSDLRVLRGLVELQLAQGQDGAALKTLRNAINRAANPQPVQELLASTLIRTRHFGEAVEELKQLVAKQPASVDLVSKLGNAYRLSGDTANAIVQFQKATELAPKQASAAVVLGQLLANEGRVKEAKARYEQALAASPDDPLILNNLALLMVETGGDLYEALTHARRALAKDPGNPHVLDTLGWIFAKMKNGESAVRILDGLIQKYPSNPTYQYHLGYAMLQNGQKVQAKRHLSLALSNSPPKQDEVAIRKLIASIDSL